MQIKNMFEKQIDRDIKGVIKVGQSDEENVYQELDEYVVTKELLKHFRDFFNNYEKGVDGYTDKMGVWISGFFGSGKSHFLKILSYLLKNSTVEGKRAIEYFTDGKKIEDPMLIAEMTKAGTIESDVMLFNIDSKGSAKVGSGKEAIVEVFMKVFNEMQGYCGSIPYLAEFERQLDNEGRFEEFKEKFEANAGAPWDKKRQAFAVIQDKVVKTLVEMDFMSEEAARNWCKNAKGSYDLSIEKFVSLVQEYCAKKGPNHHVIFLVDEIGQYIADDTQLMLNLQTIVEDLGTACKGKAFTKEEWMDILLRSTGMEPDKLSDRAKWLLIARMIPLVENNFNMCELGPRSTGKSYIYEQISPNSILVAGGQTTVANLFYNMSNNTVGLVGMWDVVAFDEVAGIKFKDKDGIQIMKGYMASGAFSRGKAEIQAKASMVFVGNINQSVETLQKTSSLFDPFPPEMGTDTAFLDRFHAYIPGWEIPKYRPDSFTNDYGFITDYLSEFMRELRKDNYSNIAEKYFKLGNNLNQRDAIAVRKLISGFIKLIYPDGEVSKEEVAEIMDISLELRRRVKEQLKKIGGMEFYDVNFSYIDNDSFDEHFVSVPEQGGGKMIPEGMGKPGCLYTVSKSKTGMIGCYRLETQMMPGNGKLTCTGIGSGKEPKEATNTAFNYLKANGNAISGNISTTTKDYIINYQDMQGLGMTGNLALPTLIAISSAALSKPPISSLAVLGEISIGGTLIKVEDLASTLQVCLDSGAKKVLLPITSAADLGTVPSDLVGAFSLIFYSSPEEAVYKALGVE